MELGSEVGRGVRETVVKAARRLAHDAGFAVTAVGVLALAVTTTATIFAAYEAVVLRALTVREPGRLLGVWAENPERGWHQEYVAPANLLDWREQVDAFADVAAYADQPQERILVGAGGPRVVESGAVTGNLFQLLGVEPLLGRSFRMEETWAESPPVVLLSHGYWMRELGGEPAAVGRSMALGGVEHEIVGVMPESFRYLVPGVEVWVPFRWSAVQRESAFFRRAHLVRAVARLRDGATADAAAVQLRAVADRLAAAYPATNQGLSAGITPLGEYLAGDRAGPLGALLLGVLLLLLAAYGTVAYLIATRAARRAPDAALRRALGATTARLSGELLAEGAWLASLAGALGAIGSLGGMRVLAATAPDTLLGSVELGIGAPLVIALAASTVVSACLFSVLPALAGADLPAAGLLRPLPGRSRARGSWRLARAFVVLQVALSVMLLLGAGLLGRSLAALRRVDPGFDRHGVLTFAVPFADPGDDAAADRFRVAEALVDRVAGVDGVERAGMVRQLPILGSGWTSLYTIEGGDGEPGGVEIVHRSASAGYFEALRVPLLRGRMLAREDAGSGVVINERFAREAFGDGEPLGRRVAFTDSPSSGTSWWTIVGVVGDERQNGLGRPVRPEVFTDLTFDTPGTVRFVVRSSVPTGPLVAAVRDALGDIDPGLPVTEVAALDSIVSDSLATERFLLLLAGTFAALATVLAVTGVYGVTSQLAAEWRAELAVRLAVGAAPRALLGMVLGRALATVAAGLALGGAGALAGARVVASLLHGTSPADPVTIASVVVVLTGAGLLAALPAAAAAMRTDPARALSG